jgi:hypothetical protein
MRGKLKIQKIPRNFCNQISKRLYKREAIKQACPNQVTSDFMFMKYL